MAEVALTALGWVASPIIEKLVQKAITFLGTDIAEELKDLETTIIPQFELVIKAAENSSHKQTVAEWLRRLKNAYYEIEDIFDELEYQRLESEVKATTSKGTSSCRSFKSFAKMCYKVNKKFSRFSPAQKELRNKLKNLRKVAEESKSLCESLKIQPLNNANQTPTNFKGPAASASIPLNKVFGRDRDRDRIIDLLVEKHVGGRNPAIAITGIGGAGKTTLAQLIFNDQRVKDHFNVRIWVCLSPKLDVIKHTKEMIQSASMKSPQLDSLDALQRTIIDTLRDSKNTLLVLDDIWYNKSTEEEEWSKLLAPFTNHEGEHRIIFTSRSTELPSALCRFGIIHSDFKEIEENDFKALFRYLAFGVDNPRQTRELEKIGDKIAEKLSGSPLAAKAVASQLSKKLNDRFWKDTLDKVKLNNDVSESLLWTYQHLDAELQRCFSYCSVFPKGLLVPEIHYVELWLCQNFIKCSDDPNNVMEKAKDYFNELIACSFFQPVSNDELGVVHYKIHDLFHDLAEELSKEDCFRIEGSTQIEIPSTVRHISISVLDLKEYIPIILKSDQVRTVIFLKPFVNDVNEIFKELLSKLPKLRVLVLRFYNNIMLPEHVGKLKHLRYLLFPNSSISELPKSLSKLYHLQVLLLNERVKKLPKNFSNLRKLRQLLMIDTYGKHVATLLPIANIGNLTSLETVREFHVRKENGFELCQLGNLKRIKGELSIRNLENSNKAHAIEAKLCEKKDIERLELVWTGCDESRSDIDLEVIEALQPHENVEHLSLENYSAAKYPSWLLKNSVIRTLSLYNCSYLQVLPSILTHCDKLILEWLIKLRNLSHMPERLMSLRIVSCPVLVFALKEDPQLSNHDLSLNETDFLAYWLHFMPLFSGMGNQCKFEYRRLTYICPVPKNNEYNEYLETFRRGAEGEQPLDEHAIQAWWRCHQQRINFVYRDSANAPEFMLPSSLTTLTLIGCNITDGALSDCLRSLTALSDLHLEAIMTLTTLPSKHVMWKLQNLKTLSIRVCWCLRSLGFVQGLVSLEKLEIGFCPCLDLKHTGDGTIFPTSLQSLGLRFCVIPDGMFTCDMPNLYELMVHTCRGSKSLSIGMLTSLRKLVLWNCPDLCKVEGLQSLASLTGLLLINLPNFQAGSLLDGPLTLEISSLEMLKVLSSNNAFAYVKYLFIMECQEETFTFEGLSRTPSLWQLGFEDCKIKVLPNSLKVLSCLEYLEFINCPEISSVPELPESIIEIRIEKCPMLKERCGAPDGPDWPKIRHIPVKLFKD